MSYCHKVICCYEICISESMMQCELNIGRSIHISKLGSDNERLHSKRSSK